MGSVLFTQSTEGDKGATISPNLLLAIVADCTTELGTASARIYLDHVYFELPVLDYPALLRSCKESATPFPKGSLLHHALLASALPWLDPAILTLHGFSNRVEAFESNLVGFEVSRERDRPAELGSGGMFG
jgi:hypothetical protein